MSRQSSAVALAVSALVVFAASASHAQQYPTRPIRLVAPFAPGGSTDTVARIVAQRLTEALGQNVLVDNRPGAGGTYGADLVAKANPDGYTLLTGDFGPNVVAAALYSKLPYDPVKSFAHVSLVVSFPLVLVTPAGSRLSSIREYIEQARTQPGKLTYGSAGVGTSPHIFMELVHSKAQARAVHVPYKGGAPALTGLLAAEVDSALIAVSTAVAQLDAGKIKALAVTSAKPSPRLPGVPPISSVVPGYDGLNFHGLHAPAGTPPSIVKRLADEVAKAVQHADTRKRFDGLAMEVAGSTPAEYEAFIRRQIQIWVPFVKSAGIRAD